MEKRVLRTLKCSVSGKAAFPHREAAEDEAVRLAMKGNAPKGYYPLQAYRCRDCGFWHLTLRGRVLSAVMTALLRLAVGPV
jgi:hypothetical protein